MPQKRNECRRCGYVWFSRNPAEPKSCPRCRSYKWKEKRK